MRTFEYCNLVASPAYQQAGRRVLRQLVEALVFENILPHTQWHGGRLIFPAQRANGAPVFYQCEARRTISFGRTRITTPIQRQDKEVTEEAYDPALFLAEIAPWLEVDKAKLSQFAMELLETQIKDAQTLHAHGTQILRDADYDIVEARLTDGHPYHPSYKSRLGFTLDDNNAHGPETAGAITPVLLAARRDRCIWSTDKNVGAHDEAGLLLVGQTDWGLFCDTLARYGLDRRDYLPLLVHPWQWNHVILPTYHTAVKRSELFPIGPVTDRYLPQQSIRTLSNVSRPFGLTLKLALSIVNTSDSRILPPHTVQNAAVISDWLSVLVDQIAWPETLARPVLLREIAGVSFVPSAEVQNQYGALSCIWRENVRGHLRPGEAAVPMTAAIHVDGDGRPFIDLWVKRYGPEAWLRRLIQCAWIPVLRLLWEHGTALESHAQNMILLHEDGLPARVALRDFPGGVCFARSLLSGPAPTLSFPSSDHMRANPGAFVETEDTEELRDFTFDALFFVNLAELAWLFERFYDMTEARFWRITREVLLAHQARYPQWTERYALFNCFSEQVAIEQLASRRLLPEIRSRTRLASNPLAYAHDPPAARV